MHQAFLETSQRPFPLPEKKWLMTQTWNQLLFCHWPIEYETIRKHVPAALELDTYDGKCWIGVIPFQVNNMHLRGLPPFPYVHTYLELNVRTYVTYNGTPGVYFFTLDANKWPAVIGGTAGALLPYRKAKMKLTKMSESVSFKSDSCGPYWMNGKLKLQYRPSTEAFSPSPTSLEYWFFERYCFFTVQHRHVYRGDIHHTHWRVEQADVCIDTCPVFLQKKTIGAPLFHYSHKKQAFMWMLSKLS